MEGLKRIWDSFRNMPKVTKITLVTIFGVFFLIIVIALAFVGRSAMVTTSLVDVVNFAEDSNVPKGYRDVIEQMISDLIRENATTSGLVFSKAELRKDTYTEEELGKAVMSKFIVDIPELEYSFAVTAVWRPDAGDERPHDPDVTVECPYYLDVIYKNKKCIAESPINQIRDYVPHYQKLENGLKFGVNVQKFDERSYLAVEIKSCGDNSLKEAAVAATKEWIKTLYMDPNDFEYETFDICNKGTR